MLVSGVIAKEGNRMASGAYWTRAAVVALGKQDPTVLVREIEGKLVATAMMEVPDQDLAPKTLGFSVGAVSPAGILGEIRRAVHLRDLAYETFQLRAELVTERLTANPSAVVGLSVLDALAPVAAQRLQLWAQRGTGKIHKLQRGSALGFTMCGRQARGVIVAADAYESELDEQTYPDQCRVCCRR